MQRSLLLPITMCCAAFALPANALMVVDRPEVKAEKPILNIASRCPPGTRLVPAGYQRKGKWRDAYCSRWVSQRAGPTDTVANQLNAQQRAQSQGGMMLPGSGGGPFGQPTPTQGVPGAWQSPASTHLPPGYR